MTNESSKFWESFRKAQGAMKDPVKDATNPHFKSKFVTLKGVLDAVREPLHKNGISIVQTLDGANVVTILRHDDGGGVESRIPVICAKANDPQAFGSALTYARRYAIAAICGIAPADDDDDGEGAVDRQQPARPPVRPAAASKQDQAPEGYDLLEHALQAIHGAQDALVLRGVVARKIKASGFQGEDLAAARQAFDEKLATFAGSTTPTTTTKKEN